MTNPTPPEPEPATAGADADAQPGAGRFVPPPPPPQPKQESQVPKHLATASKAAGRQLLRPRVRVALVGIAALLVAWWWVDGSIGTILTIGGIVALLVAWLGSRMEGRFAIEWGTGGTKVEFGNTLTPAAEPFRAPERASLAPARTSAKGLAAVPPPPPADVDGEAHTVEIDVQELQALIAAAEQAESARRSS